MTSRKSSSEIGRSSGTRIALFETAYAANASFSCGITLPLNG